MSTEEYRALIDRIGLTRAGEAKFLDVSPFTVKSYRDGTRNPGSRLGRLKKLLNAMERIKRDETTLHR